MSPAPSPVLSSRGWMVVRLGLLLRLRSEPKRKKAPSTSPRSVSPPRALMSLIELRRRLRVVRPVSPLSPVILVIELLKRRRTVKLVSPLSAPMSVIELELSPDGRWVAYVSDESGQNEIYVGVNP